MGTTAWQYEGGSWTDATSEWTSNDDWGWREELRSNGFEIEPAVRLGDIDTDSLAAEIYAADDEGRTGWAVVLTVGDGGDVVLVSKMPDLLDLLNELSPVIDRVLGMNNGAQNATEREYARLRNLGYPHDVADEASRTFAAEVADYDDDDDGPDDDEPDDDELDDDELDDDDLDDDDTANDRAKPAGRPARRGALVAGGRGSSTDLEDADDEDADDDLDDDETDEVDLDDEKPAKPTRDTAPRNRRGGLFRR